MPGPTPYDPQILSDIAADIFGDVMDISERYIEELRIESVYDAAEAAVAASASLYSPTPEGRIYGQDIAIQTLENATQRIFRNGKVAYSGSVEALMVGTMRAIVEGVYANADGALKGQMQLILENFSRRMNQRVGLKRKMDTVAAAARKATLAAYDTKVQRSTYRVGQNRLVGAVRRALQRNEWCVGTPDGVLFGNVHVLDVEAANWRRLNFGAGQAGRETEPRKGPMYFSLDRRAPGEHGTTVFTQFGLSPQPSPAFTMPRGVFVDGPDGNIVPAGGGRGQPFYTRKWYIARFRNGLDSGTLTKKQERAFKSPFSGRRVTQFFSPIGSEHKPFGRALTIYSLDRNGATGGLPIRTRGIVGYQFMDAGVASLRAGRNSLPQAYSEIFNEWFQQATRESGPLRAR